MDAQWFEQLFKAAPVVSLVILSQHFPTNDARNMQMDSVLKKTEKSRMGFYEKTSGAAYGF